MRIITKFLQRHSLVLFGFVIILIRVPPFNFFLETPLLNSYNIAGYVAFLMFVFRIWESFQSNKNIVIPKAILLVVLLFFVSQSASVLTAVNVREFVARYKDLVFALVIFFLTFTEVRSEKKFYKVLTILLISVIINVVLQAVMYFEGPIFNLIKAFFTEGYLKDFEINANRNRYFVDSYDAALLPILLIFVARFKSISGRLAILFVSLLVSVFVFLSNFRAQLVVLFLSVFAATGIYSRRLVDFLKLMPIVLITLYLVNIVTVTTIGYNALDRLIAPQSVDYLTISDRFYYWGLASDMGFSSPVFGIGLGNFFDYLPGNKLVNLSLFDPQNDFFKITWVHPHNVFFGLFAETGFFGLISFLIMIGFFAWSDLAVLFSNKDLTIRLMIVTFWLIFAFSLINPPISLSYLGIYWLIRGLISSASIYQVKSGRGE